MIDVVARIIKLNISRKEETSTVKPKGTKKCNQVMVTIIPKRNAMPPDKKPNTSRMSPRLRQDLQSHW
jgi:hypothetical protein